MNTDIVCGIIYFSVVFIILIIRAITYDKTESEYSRVGAVITTTPFALFWVHIFLFAIMMHSIIGIHKLCLKKKQN